MKHDIIWAPWRLGYVAGDKNAAPPEPRPAALLPGGDAGCFLCQAAGTPAEVDDDRTRLVAVRTDDAIVVLNRYPYNNGHLLIAPRRHVARLDEMDATLHARLLEMLSHFVTLYESMLSADGFNIGVNLGRAAGAGVPGHLHWHLVPRWSGDTNFTASVAGTRVIPQSLDALWEALHEQLGPIETAP